MQSWKDMDQMVAYLSLTSAVKLFWTYLKYNQRPEKAEYVGELAELNIYPVKSMRRIQLESAECTSRGIKYPGADVFDRNFMVVDKNGTFVHARAEPKMTTMDTAISGEYITLDCKGMAQLRLLLVPPKNDNVVNTKVWGENVQGQDCGNEAAEWISTCLNGPGLRMIYGNPGLLKRVLNKQTMIWKLTAKDSDYVTFQDLFPFMMASLSSLEDLDKKTKTESFIMQRFRPNIVISGSKPFDEDNWHEIWIGDVKFTNMKPCHRCILTTINPENGIKNENEEPLRTLRTYRLDEPNFGKSPLFGINLVLDSCEFGRIKVGDPIYVMRKCLIGL